MVSVLNEGLSLKSVAAQAPQSLTQEKANAFSVPKKIVGQFSGPSEHCSDRPRRITFGLVLRGFPVRGSY